MSKTKIDVEIDRKFKRVFILKSDMANILKTLDNSNTDQSQSR